MLFKDLFHNASAQSVLWAQLYDKIYLYLIQISQSSFILFLQESDNRCGDTHWLASNLTAKCLQNMSHFLELNILVNMTLKGTAGVCLKDEIEMLVSNIELISQSMNKLSEHVQIVGVFFSFGYCLYM